MVVVGLVEEQYTSIYSILYIPYMIYNNNVKHKIYIILLLLSDQNQMIEKRTHIHIIIKINTDYNNIYYILLVV